MRLTQGMCWQFFGPVDLILIIAPPVYLHTAFLDDFFLRSFPYTQVEVTRVLRTCGA
jgi:hypothetical protein